MEGVIVIIRTLLFLSRGLECSSSLFGTFFGATMWRIPGQGEERQRKMSWVVITIVWSRGIFRFTLDTRTGDGGGQWHILGYFKFAVSLVIQEERSWISQSGLQRR